MKPKISVVTVCFNSEKTIERTIQSVLSQDYPHIEYIIVDGASKDRTAEIVAKYQDGIAKVSSEPDKGIYDAMNKGVALASGDFIHFLNSDDWYADSNVISKVVEQVTDLQKMYHGQLCYFHQNGNKTFMGGQVQSSDLKYELKYFHQPATFFPREFFNKWGGFNLSYRVAADYDLMRRFLSSSSSSYVDVLVTNMSDGGASAKMIDTGIRENAAIAIHFGESTLQVQLRAAWVRFWLGVRYRYPNVYWLLKKAKGAF